jgi:hypothetical protein
MKIALFVVSVMQFGEKMATVRTKQLHCERLYPLFIKIRFCHR